MLSINSLQIQIYTGVLIRIWEPGLSQNLKPQFTHNIGVYFTTQASQFLQLHMSVDPYLDLQHCPVNLGGCDVSLLPEMQSLIAGIPGLHTDTPAENSFVLKNYNKIRMILQIKTQVKEWKNE